MAGKECASRPPLSTKRHGTRKSRIKQRNRAANFPQTTANKQLFLPLLPAAQDENLLPKVNIRTILNHYYSFASLFPINFISRNNPEKYGFVLGVTMGRVLVCDGRGICADPLANRPAHTAAQLLFFAP